MLPFILHLFLLMTIGFPDAAAASQDTPVILLASDLVGVMNHFDLVPERTLAASGWIGLYEGDDGWHLEPARVEVDLREREDRLDFAISAEPAGPHLLFSGVPLLSPGRAETVGGPVGLSEFGARAGSAEESFRLGTEEYTLRLEYEEPGLCDAVVTLEHRSATQILFDQAGGSEALLDPQFGCDEPHFHLHWAGDIDRDGKLDLLVTFSGKYSYHPRQLLLSAAAPGPSLVGLAGSFVPFE